MSNLEKYRKAFIEAFDADDEDLEEYTYRKSDGWDSVGHMNLISAIEDQFDIMFETDDIITLNSYRKGIAVLSEHYGIKFE